MNPITSAKAAGLAAPAQAVQRIGSQLANAKPIATASTVVSLSAQGLDRLGKEVQGAAGAVRQLTDSAGTAATAAVRGVTSTVGGVVDNSVSVVQAVQEGLEAAWEVGEDAVGAVADAGAAIYDAAASVVSGVGSAIGSAADAVGDAASGVASGISSTVGQVGLYAAQGLNAVRRGIDEIV